MTLCFTGWQQPDDALKAVAPDAIPVPYQSYPSFAQACLAIPQKCDVAIGWSLGGVVLLKALLAGVISPQKIILIATPFCTVATQHFPDGIAEQDFLSLKQHYKTQPVKALRHFHALMNVGDSRAIPQNLFVQEHGIYWLELLEKVDFSYTDLSNLPETLLIHGNNDKVISPANATAFLEKIPNATLQMLPDCGHVLKGMTACLI